MLINFKAKSSLMFFVFFVNFVFLSFSPAYAQKAYEIKDKILDEVSGITSGRTNKDLYYVHNDSGGKSEVYVLNGKGKLVFTIELKGITNRDWEDIAVGPGPDTTKSYIYVGEIGDNKAQYLNCTLYRFQEPQLKVKGCNKAQKITIPAERIEQFTCIYEDGAKDCETLFIDPQNGDVYLISKREEKVGLYQIKTPLAETCISVARRLLSLDFPLAVAGDISAKRDRIVIKTYTDVYCWDIAAGQTVVEALSEKPVVLPYTSEPQGEAICWSLNGESYLTLSEKHKDKPLYLYIYPIQKKE